LRGLALVPACALPPLAAAQATAPVPGGAAALAQLALSLLIVVALIVAFAWLARRMRLAPQGGGGALRVLAQVPVGPRERVVLLAVGDRQALVGVTSAGITSLALLDGEIAVPGGSGAGATESPLAGRMRSMLERRGRP
jgi:flagellar protein FliO/FliZ